MRTHVFQNRIDNTPPNLPPPFTPRPDSRGLDDLKHTKGTPGQPASTMDNKGTKPITEPTTPPRIDKTYNPEAQLPNRSKRQRLRPKAVEAEEVSDAQQSLTTGDDVLVFGLDVSTWVTDSQHTPSPHKADTPEKLITPPPPEKPTAERHTTQANLAKFFALAAAPEGNKAASAPTAPIIAPTPTTHDAQQAAVAQHTVQERIGIDQDSSLLVVEPGPVAPHTVQAPIDLDPDSGDEQGLVPEPTATTQAAHTADSDSRAADALSTDGYDSDCLMDDFDDEEMVARFKWCTVKEELFGEDPSTGDDGVVELPTSAPATEAAHVPAQAPAAAHGPPLASPATPAPEAAQETAPATMAVAQALADEVMAGTLEAALVPAGMQSKPSNM
jgi:hypothetical protein